MIEANLSSVPFLLLEENLPAIVNTAFRKMADDTVLEARANIHPGRSGLHNRSGKLRGSIRLRNYVQMTPGGIGTATITAGNSKVPYARIHEQGGIIRAKNAPFLVFRVGGRWIKKKQVVIPKRSYLQPAIDGKQEQFREYFNDALQELMRRI